MHMELKKKTILILSPQAWGKMFLAKHHYAISLAERGNEVYFLNPPTQTTLKLNNTTRIKGSEMKGLYLIDHSLFFPYWLKFKVLPVFHWLMKIHVGKLLNRIGKPIDIVWSFDLGYLYPFSFFGNKPFKIFHPVDEPLTREAIRSVSGADIIFSVTREILEKYERFDIPKHFINHGVQEYFIAEPAPYHQGNPIRIGFSANLLRKDIDREILKKIIKENAGCVFEFWGSFETSQSNIGGSSDDDTEKFVKFLKQCQNVILHGVVSAKELAKEFQRMDAFLICYDVQRDQSHGTNYHKVMEYIATGKVIVSNNITTYKDETILVQMISERSTNEKLPALFLFVISNLRDLNCHEKQVERIRFARTNLYPAQLDKIEKLLTI
jgi:hypothetical protein